MKLGRKPLVLALLSLLTGSMRANDLAVQHVTLREGVTGKHGMVVFDLRWDNSWRNDLSGAGKEAPFNYDAAWIFVKFSTDSGTTWRHATLADESASHGVLNDNGVPATIKAVPQGQGVFIFRKLNGTGTNNWQDVQLQWDYEEDGVPALTGTVIAKVIALEMVFIPSGDFLVGDRHPDQVNGQFEAGDSGKPFEVEGEDEITLGGGKRRSLGNNNAKHMTHKDDFNNHDKETLPAEFPKGYSAFYIMKHEITQGQYADFLNLLTRTQEDRRNIEDERDYTAFRGTISDEDEVFSAAAPDRACNFLAWQDGAAYADWAGLRPMTELEYEKAGRGDQSAVSGEFAWGNTDIILQTGHVGSDGSGSETASPAGANANFDSGINGPARAGIFASTSGGNRAQAGASFYGVMELSGNLVERVVSLGNKTGRSFTGTHGDGELTTVPGFEGNATNKDWPGSNVQSSLGVTGARGSGLRGGGWKDADTLLRLADRKSAAAADDQRANHYGFRCVRTAPWGEVVLPRVGQYNTQKTAHKWPGLRMKFLEIR
ncbi:MAG: formylglycine-generating enzyme family protein [bacterium]